MVKTSTKSRQEFWTSVFGYNTKTYHQCLVCQIPNRGTSHQSNNEIIASCLPEECTEKFTNHSTRKTGVAKLKDAGQVRHKIIQVTSHARESSLVVHDKITEGERRQLSHIASGYVNPKSLPASVNSIQVCTSTSTASSCMESLPPGMLPECMMKENMPAKPPGMLPFYMPTQTLAMVTKHLQEMLLQVFNQCVLSNAFSDSSSPKLRKRHVIIDSDLD